MIYQEQKTGYLDEISNYYEGFTFPIPVRAFRLYFATFLRFQFRGLNLLFLIGPDDVVQKSYHVELVRNIDV